MVLERGNGQRPNFDDLSQIRASGEGMPPPPFIEERLRGVSKNETIQGIFRSETPRDIVSDTRLRIGHIRWSGGYEARLRPEMLN